MNWPLLASCKVYEGHLWILVSNEPVNGMPHYPYMGPMWGKVGLAPLNCDKSPPLGHFKQCNAPTYSIPYCQLSYVLTFAHCTDLKFICKILYKSPTISLYWPHVGVVGHTWQVHNTIRIRPTLYSCLENLMSIGPAMLTKETKFRPKPPYLTAGVVFKCTKTDKTWFHYQLVYRIHESKYYCSIQ